MTVKEIITDWLKKNGYDGLCTEECGCQLGDLGPCCLSENILSCVPGYKHSCEYPCPAPCDLRGEAEGWCMRAKKLEKKLE